MLMRMSLCLYMFLELFLCLFFFCWFSLSKYALLVFIFPNFILLLLLLIINIVATVITLDVSLPVYRFGW